jgi:hypothetical protein
MKKLVSVLFALLLVGSFAFAADPGITLGGWGRMMFSPTMGGDAYDDNVTVMAPSWAEGGRVRFDVAGNSDNAGFLAQVATNGDKLYISDQAKIWVKFNDMFKVQAGRIKQDVLRGKIGDDAFFGDPDAVFQRFYPRSGLLLDVTPMEGVYIGAAIDAATPMTTITGVDDAGEPIESKETAFSINTEDAMKNIQIGFGYVIPELGHLRVQYVGADDVTKRYTADTIADILENLGLVAGAAYLDAAEADEAKYINVAFAYTAMEGLVVDVGAKLQLTADTAQHTVQIDSSYSKDALGLIFRVGASFGEDATSDDLGYSASWDLSYLVADPMTVGFEGKVSMRGDDSLAFDMVPYAKAGYGNGYLKAGFEFASAAELGKVESNSGLTAADGTGWAIPIVLEYWF